MSGQASRPNQPTARDIFRADAPMNAPDTAASGIPGALRPWFKPEAADHLRCSQVSDHEFRVEIIQASPAAVPGPLAMLGYARQFHAGTVPTTDEAMRELRG
jgi:hypothetical protein